MREMEAADWASLSDQELLERRISTLGLRLEGTALEPLIGQFYEELSAHGLVFHPPCHIGDEWLGALGHTAAHRGQQGLFHRSEPKSHSRGRRGLRAFGG